MQQVFLNIEIISKYIAAATLSVNRAGKVISRTYEVQRSDKTTNHAYVLALNEGLKHITEPVELILRLKPGYITISLQSVEKWRKNGFLNKKGEPVKYAKDWKEISRMLDTHKYTIEFVEE